MKIRSITVGYGRTHSLHDYCNVKPSLTLTVDLDPGEDVAQALDELDTTVTDYVHGKVDAALEDAGQSPRFYDGPLYTLYRWIQADTLVLLPDVVNTSELPGKWENIRACRHMRRGTLIGRAERIQGGLLDFWHGDTDEIWSWWNDHRWYAPYALYIKSADRWARDELGQILVVPQDLVVPVDLDGFRVSDIPGRDYQLPDLLSRLAVDEQFRDLWRVVVDDPDAPELTDVALPDERAIAVSGPDGLAVYVAGWRAEHRPPSEEPAPEPEDDYPEDDDYDYEDDYYGEDDYPEDE